MNTIATTDATSAVIINPTATLAEIVQPLLNRLNEKYPSPEDEYYVAPFGRYGQLDDPDDIVSVDLNVETMTDLARRAVLTLLLKSGSHTMWNGGSENEPDPYKSPLRFSIMKESMHVGIGWMWSLYLVIDHFRDIDPEEAIKQIALLTAYLADEHNLVEAGPEEQALF